MSRMMARGRKFNILGEFLRNDNKLMRIASDPVRNGVLNMTIDFNRSQSRYSPRRNTTSPIRSRGMSFIPKNVTTRPFQRGNPYLHYRHSQR